MSKVMKTGLVLFLAVLLPVTAFAQKKSDKDIFIFGYGINMKDSTAFLTPVQLVPGASVEKKTKYLKNRSVYSMQLQSFLTTQYKEPYTVCAVFFSENKESLGKKRNKVRKEQQKNSLIKIREIPEGIFEFKAPQTNEDSE